MIWIDKNLIWTILQAIFSVFWFFFAPSDSRFSNSCVSAKYCLILTNHTSMESLFIQLSDNSDDLNFKKIDPCDWFCCIGSQFVRQCYPKKRTNKGTSQVVCHKYLQWSYQCHIQPYPNNTETYSSSITRAWCDVMDVQGIAPAWISLSHFFHDRLFNKRFLPIVLTALKH